MTWNPEPGVEANPKERPGIRLSQVIGYLVAHESLHLPDHSP